MAKFKKRVVKDGKVYEEEVTAADLTQVDHIPDITYNQADIKAEVQRRKELAKKKQEQQQKQKSKPEFDKSKLYKTHGLEKNVKSVTPNTYKPKSNHLLIPTIMAGHIKKIPEFKLHLGYRNYSSKMASGVIEREVRDEFERAMELSGRKIFSVGLIRNWHVWTYVKLKNEIEIFNATAKLLEVKFNNAHDFSIKIAEIVTGQLDVEYWLAKYKEKIEKSKKVAPVDNSLEGWLKQQ